MRWAASTACTQSSGRPIACVATHPSDLCVALAALDATVHLEGAEGTRTLTFEALHRLPGDTPDRETELQARRADHRGRAAAAAVGAALDLSQGARPGELRLRPGLGRGRARDRRRRHGRATCGWRWAAWRTSRGARTRRKRLLRGAPADESSVPARRRRRAGRGAAAARQRLQGRARQADDRRRAQPACREARRRPRMSMTGILRTVLRHVPDALVPGTRPEGTRPAEARGQHGQVGAPVSRLDGALKVRGAARFAAEVATGGAALCRGRAFDDRTRPHRRPRDGGRRGRSRRRPGDDPSQRAADEGTAGVRRGRRRGRQQPAGHAGRLPSTGTARRWPWCWPRRRSRPTMRRAWSSVTYADEPAVTDFAAARATARHPESVIGEPAVVGDRRRREGPGDGRPPGRRDLYDAVPEPQRHRAARRDRRLGGRPADSCTTPPR